MSDHAAILALLFLLVVFVLYKAHKRRVDAAAKPLAWMRDVVLGILLLFMSIMHLCFALGSTYEPHEGNIWIVGRLLDAAGIASALYMVVRAVLTRQSIAFRETDRKTHNTSVERPPSAS